MKPMEKESKKCNQSCSCCQFTYRYCSNNPKGEKGQCSYWRQCGVIAFNCKH